MENHHEEHEHGINIVIAKEIPIAKEIYATTIGHPHEECLVEDYMGIIYEENGEDVEIEDQRLINRLQRKLCMELKYIMVSFFRAFLVAGVIVLFVVLIALILSSK